MENKNIASSWRAASAPASGPGAASRGPSSSSTSLGTGKSFIRHTYERFAKIVPAEHFLVVTNRRYRDLVLEHLPELRPEQVLCEPIGRNTAPRIAYAAYTLLKSDPEAEMIVTPADHFILDEEAFRGVIGECLDFAREHDALMTVGIRPTRPETGYGYIQVSDDRPISKVKCFTEKPNLELAQTFLQCGEFFWNSGIFVWTVRAIVEAFRRYLPEHDMLFGGVMRASAPTPSGTSWRWPSPSAAPSRSTTASWRRPTTYTSAAATSAGATWAPGARSTSTPARTATPTPRPPRGATSTTRGAASSRCPRARWPSSAA